MDNNTNKRNTTRFLSFTTLRGGENVAPLGASFSKFSLPCLYRNNSIEIPQKEHQKLAYNPLKDQLKLQAKYRKNSVALATNIEHMANKYGLEKLGFLTLTFADFVTDYKEASKRFNSLASNVLNIRYKDFIKVMERCKSGRIHFHLVVALSSDIRSGFDFQAIKASDYRTANTNIRTEWAFWRKTAKKYRFGRTELLPIKSTSEGIARYVGKYISKHMEHRVYEDKGARLVSYSKGVRVMNTKFSWVTEGATEWRIKVAMFAAMVSEKTGCEISMDGLSRELGSKWAYNNREFIINLKIKS
jgi:hypothetical protein